MEDQREYLALIFGPMGSNSWARGKDKDKQARNAARIFKSDWKHLFTLKKGGKFTVNIYDVTEFDSVWWDGSYVKSGETDIPRLEVIEV